MFEAEIKAEISDIKLLLRRLEGISGKSRRVDYRDCYYDTPAQSLFARECELRIRAKVYKDTGNESFVVTYKGKPFDESTKSKEETETEVDDGDAVAAIFESLGYGEVLRFTKECTNYEVGYLGRAVHVTVAHIAEVNRTFIECEIQYDDADSAKGGIGVLNELLREIGVPARDVTTEYYTDMIRSARANSKE